MYNTDWIILKPFNSFQNEEKVECANFAHTRTITKRTCAKIAQFVFGD